MRQHTNFCYINIIFTRRVIGIVLVRIAIDVFIGDIITVDIVYKTDFRGIDIKSWLKISISLKGDDNGNAFTWVKPIGIEASIRNGKDDRSTLARTSLVTWRPVRIIEVETDWNIIRDRNRARAHLSLVTYCNDKVDIIPRFYGSCVNVYFSQIKVHDTLTVHRNHLKAGCCVSASIRSCPGPVDHKFLLTNTRYDHIR